MATAWLCHKHHATAARSPERDRTRRQSMRAGLQDTGGTSAGVTTPGRTPVKPTGATQGADRDEHGVLVAVSRGDGKDPRGSCMMALAALETVAPVSQRRVSTCSDRTPSQEARQEVTTEDKAPDAPGNRERSLGARQGRKDPESRGVRPQNRTASPTAFQGSSFTQAGFIPEPSAPGIGTRGPVLTPFRSARLTQSAAPPAPTRA